MKHADLIARLEHARVREVPDARALLERAFPVHSSRADNFPAGSSPADNEREARALPLPLAVAASTALVVASSTPLWIEPAEIDRERTATLIEATFKTAELCVRDWNQVMDEHE